MGMMGAIPRADRWHTIHEYVPGQPIPALVRDPETGKVYLNELKRYVKPFTLVTEPAAITLPANGISDPIPMTIDAKGHFEICEAFFTSQQPQGFTVALFDANDRMLFQNREVHVATVASGGGVTTGFEVFPATSSAGRPFKWPETFFMDTDRQKAIFAVFRNMAGDTNTIRFMLHGRRWYHAQAPSKIAEKMDKIYRERFRTFPFFYTTEQDVNLAASGFGEFEIRFTDEAWVEWVKSMRFASGGNFNILIREKTTGKRYMETAIRDDLVFGNGEFPFLNWESSLFEPNFKLVFEITNLNTLGSNRIFTTLATRKILPDPWEAKLVRPGEAVGR
jgi:hypothetical protein